MSQRSAGKSGESAKKEIRKKPPLDTWIAAVAAVNAGMAIAVAAEAYRVSRGYDGRQRPLPRSAAAPQTIMPNRHVPRRRFMCIT
ncbi:hypothetical protein PF010_g5225 [Phytophthora fragariae]|uniref:Uncharacterized protein n=1 Tax=Phytophthora fragariae TaxID=53985 RepID=A0A6G0LQD5_9STRA|nr:hypothetical protein PF010_g5225 [Phytophthora fragariae]KAE9241275.1 hypothetical protein PF004_g7132 [Phytophthora fragariae]